MMINVGQRGTKNTSIEKNDNIRDRGENGLTQIDKTENEYIREKI